MDSGEGSRGKTTIEDLPSELLYEIFRRVKSRQTDMDNMQQVCRRWFAVIDEWLGTPVTSSTRRMVHPSNPNVIKEGLELISEIGVSSFCAWGNYMEIQECPPPPEPLPFFKLPYLLKKLILDAPLHPDVFSNLTKDLTNLALFEIGVQVIVHLRKRDLEHLNFPRLKILRVTIGTNIQENLLASSLGNLQIMLKENRFPWLTRLKVIFPVQAFDDLETLKILVPFILAHRALEVLTVWMSFPREMNSVDNSTYQKELDSIIARIKGGECSRSLKELTLGVYWDTFRGNYPHLEVWSEFLKKPNSLEFVKLALGPISYKVLQTLCSRNGSTLEELQLSQYANSPGIPIVGARLDCRALSALQLQSPKCRLQLWGNHEVIGVRHLPSNLKEITLSGFMRSEEVEALILDRPNMDYIYLHNIYNGEEGYGVSLDILHRFVQNRKVSFLILAGDCMSEEFPSEGIPNGDPVNPTRLTFEHDRNRHLHLNKDGYYNNGSEQ